MGPLRQMQRYTVNSHKVFFIWTYVCKPLKSFRFTAENLQKGHNYQFRVKAVNAEGASEPLQTEKDILAKNPFGN